MVRSIHKINIIFIITLLIGAVAVLQNGSSVNADTENVDFNVNVTEALTVSISTPTSWASGDADNLLRNKVTVSALTNNNSGVTVSMYAANTDLQNTTSYSSTDATTYIPTLDATTYTYNTFPSNAWGYSLEDSVAGTASASYLPMTDDTTAPIAVLNSTLGSQGSQDVYFGAKASTAKKAGTYAQTVYFTAVTGTIDSDNPKDPEYPSTPTDPTPQLMTVILATRKLVKLPTLVVLPVVAVPAQSVVPPRTPPLRSPRATPPVHMSAPPVSPVRLPPPLRPTTSLLSALL